MQPELAFNGDHYLLESCLSLKKTHAIKTAIETGTHVGYTTAVLAGHFEKVHTIETKPEHLARARAYCQEAGIKNIIFHLGSSVDRLPLILKELKKDETPLIYLDGHWENEPTPLLRELEIIAESGIRPVLMIHDFKVPGHPELGFDTYDGQPYEWNWVKEKVNSMYQEKFVCGFNTRAAPNSAKRGCLFIEPI